MFDKERDLFSPSLARSRETSIEILDEQRVKARLLDKLVEVPQQALNQMLA